MGRGSGETQTVRSQQRQQQRQRAQSKGPREHHALELISPDGELVDIDHEIIPLIESLWQHDISTLYSCQGGSGNTTDASYSDITPGRAYVMVVGYQEAGRMLQALQAQPETAAVIDDAIEISPRSGKSAWVGRLSAEYRNWPDQYLLDPEMLAAWEEKVQSAMTNDPEPRVSFHWSPELTPAVENAWAELPDLDKEQFKKTRADWRALVKGDTMMTNRQLQMLWEAPRLFLEERAADG